MTFLTIVWVLALFASFFFLGRNSNVYHERMMMIEQVSHASTLDILMGREFHWRYEAFRAVSYNDMMWKFWKSPRSFYANMDFCQAPGVGEVFDVIKKRLEVR